MTKKNSSIIDKSATDVESKGFTRRDFLTGVTAAAGALALSGLAGRESYAQNLAALPPAAASGIEHIIVVMMENRSFDHFLGWLPNADGRQAGLTYVDRTGRAFTTHHLTDFQGCSHPDPDHSSEGGAIQYNNGACDGWLRSGDNDEFAIGYYTADDLAFYRQVLPHCTTSDRYFCALMSQTYPNRIFQHAGATDRFTNTLTTSQLPTIWDRLAARGLTGTYYFNDLPLLGLWGSRYINISKPYRTFLTDCAAGTLPQVSYVDPAFGGEEEGISRDDHPHADIRDGQAFLYEVYRAVTTSPLWSKTVLLINYDEWGGFYDHVPPPFARDPQGNIINLNGDNGFRGFRVPFLMISPWSRPGHIAHTVYDHTSILKLISWRWNLPPLTLRDMHANNLAAELDFTRPPRLTMPAFNVPAGPFGLPCQQLARNGVSLTEDWDRLRLVARQNGWIF